jgi:hypothetical protein
MVMGNIHGLMVNFIRVIGKIIKSKHYNDCRTGKGKYVWPDGKVYEGDFVND